RAAGGARHPAGGPAAGAPCCRAITAHPVRRPDEAGHGAAQQAGRAHLDDSAEGNLETHLQRLDVGAVSIILPCYNEQDHVTLEVARICAAMDASGYEYELLAFNDASTDDTLARLYEAAPSYPHMKIVSFHRNGGSGTVRRIGTQRALGEIVVWTDADMTYPNERIPELVQILEKDATVDQVVGARTSEEGTHKFLRVPAKWFIRKLAERLTNSRIPDLNSG